ncbi:Hypothetical_protein [Hexamita inflata]|uniref:Hypothetical_protein n=1 Tax=Hexamita inflata TaxID=28002 RepID=A0AA86UR93_9EUKA|nr:Hypothetical protein HINF_LOCUS49096 [Hexamita inflata]
MPIQLQNQQYHNFWVTNSLLISHKRLQQYSNYACNTCSGQHNRDKVKLNGDKYQLNFKKCSSHYKYHLIVTQTLQFYCYSTDENYQKKLVDNWYSDIYHQMEGIPIVLVGVNQEQQCIDLNAQKQLQKEIYAKYFVPFFQQLDNTHVMMENIVQCTLKKQRFGKYFKLC